MLTLNSGRLRVVVWEFVSNIPRRIAMARPDEQYTYSKLDAEYQPGVPCVLHVSYESREVALKFYTLEQMACTKHGSIKKHRLLYGSSFVQRLRSIWSVGKGYPIRMVYLNFCADWFI